MEKVPIHIERKCLYWNQSPPTLMEKGIILFDGYCNFCSGSVRFIIRRDKKAHFIFAASQTLAGQDIISRFGLGDLPRHSMVLIEQDKVYRKSTAALRIARGLPFGWRLFYGFMILPRRFRDLIYDLIARNRYRIFGMRDQCFFPEPEIRHRFLSKE